MEKVIKLTSVCLMIVSLAIMITDPANASPLSKTPFMKADIDQVANGSLSSGIADRNRTSSWIQKENTSAVPIVIDDTLPVMRAPWLPAGSELLILEVPLSEPSSFSQETDSTGALLIYYE